VAIQGGGVERKGMEEVDIALGLAIGLG